MSAFGDRMKLYESLSDQRMMPLAPVCVRIDGRAFHTWTRGLNKPYDDRLRETMIDVSVDLVHETNARIAHTFSDEISLVFLQEDFKSEIFFGGKLQKMCSVLASLTTGYFAQRYIKHFGKEQFRFPAFDCRVWNVPTIDEASNYLVWREQDAVSNSIQMAARSMYSHKQCHKKTSDELQEMLHQKGINWNDYPAKHKRGQYVKRIKKVRPFTSDEMDKLPEKHEARRNPELKIERTDVERIEVLPITKMTHEERIQLFFGQDD